MPYCLFNIGSSVRAHMRRPPPRAHCAAVLLNQQRLLRELFSETYFMRLVGILEYDPEVTPRQRHRDFLRNTVVFREVRPLPPGIGCPTVRHPWRTGGGTATRAPPHPLWCVFVRSSIVPDILRGYLLIPISLNSTAMGFGHRDWARGRGKAAVSSRRHSFLLFRPFSRH